MEYQTKTTEERRDEVREGLERFGARWMADTMKQFIQDLIADVDGLTRTGRLTPAPGGDAGSPKDISGAMENISRIPWGLTRHFDGSGVGAAEEVKTALKSTCSWLAAALECKAWRWDGDQREAAEAELSFAREALAKADGR